jgi:hypothetical protein
MLSRPGAVGGWIGCRTSSRYAAAETRLSPALNSKAWEKLPVRCTIKPVTSGRARLPDSRRNSEWSPATRCTGWARQLGQSPSGAARDVNEEQRNRDEGEGRGIGLRPYGRHGAEGDAAKSGGDQQLAACDGRPAAPCEKVAEPAAGYRSQAAEKIRDGGHNSHARTLMCRSCSR